MSAVTFVGVGKSLVSTILDQWFLKIGAPVKAYDLDQENTTLAHYQALSVTHLSVMKPDRTIDPKQFDKLMIDILESPESENGMNYVIDTGANTFSPLLAYLIANFAFDAIRDAGKKPIIHSIIGGGDLLADTREPGGGIEEHRKQARQPRCATRALPNCGRAPLGRDQGRIGRRCNGRHHLCMGASLWKSG